MEMRKEISKWLATPSKYSGLRADIAAEVMIGFWFSTGVILAVRIVDGLGIASRCLPWDANEVATKMAEKAASETATTKAEESVSEAATKMEGTNKMKKPQVTATEMKEPLSTTMKGLC